MRAWWLGCLAWYLTDHARHLPAPDPIWEAQRASLYISVSHHSTTLPGQPPKASQQSVSWLGVEALLDRDPHAGEWHTFKTGQERAT